MSDRGKFWVVAIPLCLLFWAGIIRLVVAIGDRIVQR
jgi:hypothetical protein